MKDCTIRVAGHKILVLDGPYVVDGKPTEDAKQFAACILDSLEDIRRFACDKLLAKYNSAWRDEDELKLDESTFCVSLEKPSVVIYDEIGYAIVYFKPKKIFDGHSVTVTFEAGKPRSATLVG